MRIGTWNLAGRWSDHHEELLRELDCDVLLLTEVSGRLTLDGYHAHRTVAEMAPKRAWAAVLSRRPLQARPDPHFATAVGVVEGVQFVSSILPWRGCGARWPGTNTHERTELALAAIAASIQAGSIEPGLTVWGGDWNHAFSGTEYAGSVRGRAEILRVIESLGLDAVTASLPHTIVGLLSIDHIAVPVGRTVASAVRVVAETEGRRLSDHDAYLVDLA